MSQPWTPPPPPGTGTPANIPNYLIPSILVTLFCCLPVGLVSIIYAAQVNSKIAAGDIQGAMAASKNAKTWMFVAVGLGLVAIIIAIVVNVLGLLATSR
jgi:interferon-induced transmembrane protein